MALQNSQDRFNGVVASLAIKAPCKTVSEGDGNILLEGEQTVGGIALVGGDRVLLIEQTDPIENGIYCVDTSAWQRTADWDGNRDVAKGTLVTVNRPPNNLTTYVQVNLGVAQDEPAIGVDPVNFTIFFSQTNSLDDISDVDLTGCTDSDLMHWVGGVLVCTLGELTYDNVTLYANGNIRNDHAQIRDVAPDNTTPTLNPKVGEIWTGWGGNAVGQLAGILDDDGASGIRAMLLDRPATGHTTRRWNREQITASTTQTQGNGQLTSSLVDVNVVANDNDTVTLIDPQSALDHVIMNRGANILQIFPAAGHNLGLGTDNPMTLRPGGSVWFVGLTTSRWQIMSIGDGSGSVPGAFRGCKAFSSVNIALPNDAAPAFPVNANEIVLPLNAEAFDTDTIHDNVTFNSRLTTPVGVTRIILRGGATMDPILTGLHHLRMRKNGGSGTIEPAMGILIPHYTIPAGGSGSDKGQHSFSSGVISTTAGDYYEMYGLGQNNLTTLRGGTIWFEMEIKG